jgi:hypothetical protein
MNELFRRLKQRKLVQWTLAYVRCYRIFTTIRAGMHFCARWAWPTTN